MVLQREPKNSLGEQGPSSSASDEPLLGAAQMQWIIGISLLLFAQVLSSLLGVYQEYTYERTGRADATESMFYCVCLRVPMPQRMLTPSSMRLRYRSS